MLELTPLTISGIDPASPIIIAGPCSAESEMQTLATANALKDAGIKIYRAGIWKPRTFPGCFEGVGTSGLKWLRRVKEETGMCVATEVATGRHATEAVKAGVDVLWIGARTTGNPFAVQEIADALSQLDIEIPILVKNPLNPDIDLWIGALQRLNKSGQRMLGAIHRGFSAYDPHIYRNLPQWHIPIELKRRLPQLPILCDPSHIAGKRDLVDQVAQEALDLCFDGLIIESHCNPNAALSDKEQQLTPSQLRSLIDKLHYRHEEISNEELNNLRQQIDSIDNELLDILARRMNVSRKIGEYKKRHDMTAFQLDRHDDMMQRRVNAAEDMGLSPEFVRKMISLVHEESVRKQLSILNEN